MISASAVVPVEIWPSPERASSGLVNSSDRTENDISDENCGLAWYFKYHVMVPMGSKTMNTKESATVQCRRRIRALCAVLGGPARGLSSTSLMAGFSELVTRLLSSLMSFRKVAAVYFEYINHTVNFGDYDQLP